MKIAVYGAGGVGGYFGGRLAQAGFSVHLIARGRHLEALQTRGLKIQSVLGDLDVRLPATEDPREIGPCDLVLFCVKSNDTEKAAARLPALLHQETVVVSLQNGVDNEDILAEIIHGSCVLGGAAFIFSTISEPGVVRHVGKLARVIFGELDGSQSARAKRLLGHLQRAGIETELSENIRVVLWSKFALICAQSGITAAADLPIGELRSVPETWELFQDLVAEVCRLAVAEGVALPKDTVEKLSTFAQNLDPTFLSSLQYDKSQGKRMELETLHGTVLRRATRHGLKVPMTQTVYALLKPWALRNER